MSSILGVDPGISGALAFVDQSNVLAPVVAYDMPLADKTIHGAEIARIIKQHLPMFAVVERVHAMPKQGVSSSFNFGYSHGMVMGVLAALNIPVFLVSPTVWKRHFRLAAEKEEARALAISMWPAYPGFSKKKDHGRAEAALLAKYGAECLVK